MDGIRRYAGIDWAKDRHAVCVVDGQGRAAARFEVGHTDAGLRELVRRLTAAHPWRRVAPGTKLATTIEAEREGRTDSLNSWLTDSLNCDRRVGRGSA